MSEPQAAILAGPGRSAIFLTFVVLGVYSIPRLKIEAVPDVNLPTLTVNTQWNGASPQAVQRRSPESTS